MRADQLPLLTSLSAPSLAPDGTWAVLATSRPDFDADTYTGQLWRVPLDGGAPRRLTRGVKDAAPQVSPDGRVIAFLRAVEGRPQLALVEADGGEPLVVTDAKLGVSEFCFSPDSRTIAYTSRVPDKGRYGDEKGIAPGQEDPRSFTGNRMNANGLGWYRDRPSQVFTIELPDLTDEPKLAPVGRARPDKDAEPTSLLPTPRRVTDDSHDWGDLAFTADGRGLVAAAARHDSREDDLRTDLWLIDLTAPEGNESSGAEEGEGAADAETAAQLPEPRLLTGAGAQTLSAHSPVMVGERIFFLASDMGESGRDFVGNHSTVWSVDIAGSMAPRQLNDQTITPATRLVAHDGGVLFADNHRGTGRLVHITDAEATGIERTDAGATVLTDGALVASTSDAAAGRVVCVVRNGHSMGELAVLDGGELRVLTDFSAALREQTRIAEPVEVTASAPDGYPVHGWVVLPEGASADQPVPTLLMIHGGPYASYDKAFFDETQVYVEAGYGVVMCNPRGSQGYGRDHGRAIKSDMGNLDRVDIIAFLEHALEQFPQLDSENIGVMGGSYGGYMTAWLIAHDHRWKGAIVERGFLDSWSFIGSSDIGWFFPREYNGYEREQADRQSPMTYVDQVTTPTLVIHSEQDLRCPLHQAMQYYALLRANGTEAELFVFPGENHELSRSGTPWHRRQRFEKILDFWGRHLPVSAQKRAD